MNERNRRSEQQPLKPDQWALRPGVQGKSKAKRVTRQRREWTKEEDAVLRKNYPKHGSAHTARLLGRNVTSVQHRALRLGIPGKGRRAWTPKELVYLRHNYGRKTALEIARALGRTEESIRARIRELGLTKPPSLAWTADEIEYLRKHYGQAPNTVLSEELGRSIDAIEIKAGRLGLSRKSVRLTTAQVEWVKSTIGSRSYESIAHTLGIGYNTVARIAQAAELRPKFSTHPWSEEEDAFLREHQTRMSKEEIALRLRRKPSAVGRRSIELGLTTNDEIMGQRYTEEEDRMLLQLIRTHTLAEIAELLGRSYNSVKGRCRVLGARRTSSS